MNKDNVAIGHELVNLSWTLAVSLSSLSALLKTQVQPLPLRPIVISPESYRRTETFETRDHLLKLISPFGISFKEIGFGSEKVVFSAVTHWRLTYLFNTVFALLDNRCISCDKLAVRCEVNGVCDWIRHQAKRHVEVIIIGVV
jgi:hypothetical protein